MCQTCLFMVVDDLVSLPLQIKVLVSSHFAVFVVVKCARLFIRFKIFSYINTIGTSVRIYHTLKSHIELLFSHHFATL